MRHCFQLISNLIGATHIPMVPHFFALSFPFFRVVGLGTARLLYTQYYLYDIVTLKGI